MSKKIAKVEEEIVDPQSDFQMPIGGAVVKALITAFCQRPYKGDDSWESCSIGVGPNSIVANDGSSAILIGKFVPGGHYATQRKEALLEAERSNLYGAVSVDLFTPANESEQVVGFKFTFSPDEEHINLFSDWEGDIDVQGVFAVRRSSTTRSQPELEDDEAETTTVQKQRKPKASAVAQAPTVAHKSPTEPTPEIAILDRDYDATSVIARDGYTLPSLALLSEPSEPKIDKIGEHSGEILATLRSFGVNGRVAKVHPGPTVSLYELEIPNGIKTSKVAELSDNVQMALGVSSVIIQAPIPGKRTIGFQVPTSHPRTVFMREIAQRKAFMDSPSPLMFTLGLDILGQPVCADLASMPHLLIGGTTNSGKSIGLATILSSLLVRNTPKDLRLVLIDPKRVELTLFDGIPHLMCPVIKDVKEAPGVLRAVWREMDKRYDLLSDAGVRNIVSYNEKVSFQDRMPYIVVVIDELSDLMIQAKNDVETTIVRLSQLARAVGIHLIVATQRPSVDVITGLIKANIPSRIAFNVASQVDSRTIIDGVGAEKLLGRGDMLFSHIEASKPMRVQGCFVSEAEVAALCEAWRTQGKPDYQLKIAFEDPKESDSDESDSLYAQALAYARDGSQISTSMLQRRFKIGFQEASRILDRMERDKVIGPRTTGSSSRKVIG